MNEYPDAGIARENAYLESFRSQGFREWTEASVNFELARSGPVALAQGAVLTAHLMPDAPGLSEESMRRFIKENGTLPSLPGHSGFRQMTESGPEFVDRSSSVPRTRVRIHWDGAIESYWALVPDNHDDTPNSSPQYRLYTSWIHWQSDEAGTENSALGAVYRYADTLIALGATWPLHFTMSLREADQVFLWSDRNPLSQTLKRASVLLPIWSVSDSDKLEEALKAAQERLWNAFDVLHPRQQ